MLTAAGKEMGENICRLAEKLFPAEESSQIPVVLAGGVYTNAEWYVPAIEAAVKKASLSPQLIVPSLPPVSGSIFAALKNATSEQISEPVRSTIEKALTV